MAEENPLGVKETHFQEQFSLNVWAEENSHGILETYFQEFLSKCMDWYNWSPFDRHFWLVDLMVTHIGIFYNTN